jgi:hypothetical protein
MMNVHDFYIHFQKSLTLPAALPPGPLEFFFNYFDARGISADLIAEAQIMPLTPEPSEKERKWYETHRKAARLNTQGIAHPSTQGIGFPYFIDAEKFTNFARERIVRPSADFEAYYREQKEKPPKCLSPSKKAIHAEAKQQGKEPATVHLYILPAEAEKIRKPACDIAIIEGEAKTLALVQDLRTIEDDRLFAGIGISGVDLLIPAWETKDISWKNRSVYLFFDADSAKNPAVARAEIKAAAYLLTRGARNVLSCVWNPKAGNGYDDMQVRTQKDGYSRKEKLQGLLDKAIPTFRKYAPTEEKEGLPLKTFCEAIGKVPNLGHYKTMFEAELLKLFRRQGYKQKQISELLDLEINSAEFEDQKQKRDEQAERMRALFGISYTPALPKNFYPKDGKLFHFETPLSNMFVIRKYISTDDPEKQDTYLLKFAKENKEIELPSDDFSRCQQIAKVFNRNREILCDATSKKIQQYIAEYWGMNEDKITITKKVSNTGWQGGEFLLPTLNADLEFDHYIKDAFYLKGSEDIQQSDLAKWLREGHPAMLQVLCGFCSPLLSVLNLQNITVLTSGDPGGGKSTGGFVALSQFGYWDKLKFTMNNTSTGKEIISSMFKDLPVLMDEANTGGKDGASVAQMVLETIYGWESGKGRARGTTNITLRKVNEYNGILFLTSERSLETILSVTRNMNVGGAYRRVLEIPATKPLWKFQRQQEKEFFSGIYDSINSHFGHIGARWLRHISDPHVQHSITRQYKTELQEFGKKHNLKGTDNLVCLLYAVFPELESVLRLPQGLIMDKLGDFLNVCIKHNETQVEYYIKDGLERFMDALESFMSENLRAFEGLCPRDEQLINNFGKYDGPVDINGNPKEDPDAPYDVYLRPESLEKICNAHGFNKQGVIEHLLGADILQQTERSFKAPDGKMVKRPDYLMQKYYRGRNWKCYHLKVNYQPEEATTAPIVKNDEPAAKGRIVAHSATDGFRAYSGKPHHQVSLNDQEENPLNPPGQEHLL